ncbi:MAG: DUF2304 family protein [Phycisphaera sp.]|nr:DUF2304 family protein [Phycisphaera sp.]
MIRTLILAIFGGVLLFLTVRSLRAHRLKEVYALLFGALGLPFLVLSLWPDGIVFVSDVLRIEKPTVLVLFLTVFVVALVFKLFSIVSVQQQRIATLTQIVGVLMEKQGLARYEQQATMKGTDDGGDQPSV